MAEYIAVIDRSIGPLSISVDVRVRVAGEVGESREAMMGGVLIGFLRNHIESGIGLAHLIVEQGAPLPLAAQRYIDIAALRAEIQSGATHECSEWLVGDVCALCDRTVYDHGPDDDLPL